MKSVRRASFRLAACFPVVLHCQFLAAGPLVEGTQADVPVDKIEVLAESLEAWLDVRSDYKRNGNTVAIELVDPVAALDHKRLASGSNATTRGYYDHEKAVIFLVEPWSADNDRDASVLLHELIHHRQAIAGHWYCQGAKELPAYKLQRSWLAERGQEIQVNWIEIVLESGCARRDIHPD